MRCDDLLNNGHKIYRFTYPQETATSSALFLREAQRRAYDFAMKKSGKSGKPIRRAFKIKIRGKDNAPLSIREIRDWLYEAGVIRFQPICDVRRISHEKRGDFLTVIHQREPAFTTT
jgi:hypothetical protein